MHYKDGTQKSQRSLTLAAHDRNSTKTRC